MSSRVYKLDRHQYKYKAALGGKTYEMMFFGGKPVTKYRVSPDARVLLEENVASGHVSRRLESGIELLEASNDGALS